MKAFLPQATSGFLRRVLFQVHLWGSVLAGFYIVVVCVTGAVLVFGLDLERMAHPHLFTSGGQEQQTHPADVMESVRSSYPEWRVSYLEAPTTARPTYLAEAVGAGRVSAVFVDPAGAEVLGELPQRTHVRTLQAIHSDLLFGASGRAANGVGAGVLLVLCISGMVIWWPGVSRLRRGLTIDLRRDWTRVIRDLHGAVGAWTVAFVLMWALTGIYFAFPSQFESAIDRISPIGVSQPPLSSPSGVGTELRPTWRELIDVAQTHAPVQFVARVVLPSSDQDAFHVMFSQVQPASTNAARLTSVYLDQFTGELLRGPHARRTAGDRVVAWMEPLHAGTFAGSGVKVAWLILGLSPPLLYGTGFVMWFTRMISMALRPRN